jgi:hypothetical protein
MKLYLKYFSLFLLFLPLMSFGQFFTGGIEGEVSTSSVKISDIPNQAVTLVNGENIAGYGAGLFLRFNLAPSPFYIKPKFLLTRQNGTVTVNYPDKTESVNMELTRLEIPLLAGLNIIGPLSIEAGPVYNRIISATENFNGEDVAIKPGGLGYRIGANAQFSIIGVNVAYQGVWNNSSQSLSSFQSPNQLIFGVSLSFGE